ncbi:MAG: hypothetical protein ACJ74U_17230 [Jatrophihabitantaceae bacterium]
MGLFQVPNEEVMFMGTFRLAAAAVTLCAAVCALNGGPAGASAKVSATLSATPGVSVFVDSDAYETFTGCGYQPATGTTIVVTTPSAISFFGGVSDARGCIDIVHNGFIDSAGTYGVRASQTNPKSGKSTLMASTTFLVTS